MKVIVFGSTGTVGKHLIRQALEKDLEVKAFSRDISKWRDFNHSNLKIHTGDVFDKEEVHNAIEGQDVVVVVLGSGKSRKSAVRSEGTRNIIEAMKATGVRRLVCQTTLGAGSSRGNLNIFWKYIMFGWWLKEVLLDHELQEKYIMDSKLDWTIVRPGAFTDGQKTGKYRHGFSHADRSVKLKISRADVADFILRQLHSALYLHQSPGISY